MSNTNNSITQLLRDLGRRLEPVAGDCAAREAEEILQSVLGKTLHDLYLSPQKELPAKTIARLNSIIDNRQKGRPLAYALGKKYFHSLELTVSPDVLIPRPDTEILVETVLKHEAARPRFFFDLGTGSGAIAAVLLNHRPAWRCIASDISMAALCVARVNFPPHHARLVCADMFSAFNRNTQFDFIVCNPPYISRDEFDHLDKDVLYYEPRLALYGGDDGLDFYRILARSAKMFLTGAGMLYCEIGYLQEEAATDIFRKYGWSRPRCIRDLAERPRVIIAEADDA